MIARDRPDRGGGVKAARVQRADEAAEAAPGPVLRGGAGEERPRGDAGDQLHRGREAAHEIGGVGRREQGNVVARDGRLEKRNEDGDVARAAQFGD